MVSVCSLCRTTPWAGHEVAETSVSYLSGAAVADQDQLEGRSLSHLEGVVCVCRRCGRGVVDGGCGRCCGRVVGWEWVAAAIVVQRVSGRWGM